MIVNSKTLYPSSFLAVFTGGLITGTLQVVLSISYAALVYGGELTQYVGQGIGFALVGALVIASVITLFAALPGTVGSNQDVSVAIFSLISASIVATMPHNASVENTFYTVVMAIALTVFLTGLFFLLLGTFRLGGLVRYFPYPVVGGFLAGTGWLLFRGGFTLTAGNRAFSELLQPLALVYWLPGLLFAVIILLATKHVKNNCILPGLVIGGIVLFYGTAWLLGYSPDKLSTQGWLLGPLPDQALWEPISLSKLPLANWTVIANQAANILTVLTVSSIALLLNASAFELEAKQDIDLDKELRLAGIGNLLSSICPGFVGFRQLCLTVLNYRIGAQSRFVGLIGVFIIALTLFFGAPIISYFPKIIMASVLMYLGLTFLVEWAVETWFTLPKVDFFIIWLVLLVIAAVGFMPGVAVGLVAALIMFVVSFSRTEVIRHELTGSNYQSPVPRKPEQRQILDTRGERLYILQLQGFIFFGTANRLFNQIKTRFNDIKKNRPDFIVLDFQRVEILDSTGLLSFRKLKDLTNVLQIHLVITAASRKIQRQLMHGGLPSSHTFTHYFPHLNTGIEWCEEQILEQAGKRLDTPISLKQQLSSALLDTDSTTQLLQYLERMEITPGSPIIVKGEPSDDVFFIESGEVISTMQDQGDSLLHLETLKNGRVIGDIGFYLGHPRTADVTACEQCIIYRLSANDLKKLEKENPAIASMLHQVMVRLLAERVTHLVKTVNALNK